MGGCLLAGAPPAHAAFFFKPYLKQTFGSRSYSGTSASVDLGDALHCKPAYDSYRSDASSGTFRTYSLDATYDREELSFTAMGGYTPTVDNYNSLYAGGRVARGHDFKEGPIRGIDLSASLTQTVHTETIKTPAVTAGNQSIPAQTGKGHLQQTQLEGSVEVALRSLVLGLDVAKSVYDRDLPPLAARPARGVRLAGFDHMIEGFPDLSVVERIELDAWPDLAPYVSYTYTSFKTAAIAAAYAAGVDVFLSGLKLEASYQRYAQKGGADADYYGLSAVMRFR